jgi:signal transduction histidine kinase
MSGPRLFFGVVAAMSAAILLVRRRYSVAASLSVCALFMIPTALGWFIESTSMVLMLVVAIFAAGRYGARPAAYLAVPASSLVLVASTAVDPGQGGLASWPWSLNTVWIFVLGAAFRHERILRQQVAEAAKADSRAAAAEARVQVARDLHDVLSHSLSVVAVQAEVADTFLESDQDKARQAIRRVATTARAALTDTRRMVGLLRDPDTD